MRPRSDDAASRRSHSRLWFGRCRSASPALLALLLAGCDGGLGESATIACSYEVRTPSSCSDADAPWSARCVMLASEEACASWTAPVAQPAASCTWLRDYRNVTPDPTGDCGPSLMATSSDLVGQRGRALGEPCADGSWCASGVCAFGQYCTRPCASVSDCEPALAGGCCVGATAGEGLCMDAAECISVCGANAHPVGLPTRCMCDAGFVADDAGEHCIADQRRAPGEPCTTSADCVSGTCLGDAAQGRAWCSLACTGDPDCAPLLDAEGVARTCCIAAVSGNRCAIDDYCP